MVSSSLGAESWVVTVSSDACSYECQWKMAVIWQNIAFIVLCGAKWLINNYCSISHKDESSWQFPFCPNSLFPSTFNFSFNVCWKICLPAVHVWRKKMVYYGFCPCCIFAVSWRTPCSAQSTEFFRTALQHLQKGLSSFLAFLQGAMCLSGEMACPVLREHGWWHFHSRWVLVK